MIRLQHKLVVSAATGVNQIDLDACRARKIAVANVAGYSTESVAQHTFSLILELATRTTTYASTVRQDWPASPVFTRLDHPTFELAGTRLSADMINVAVSTSSAAKGETLLDTAATLNAMHPDLIVVRHPASGAVPWIAVMPPCGEGMSFHALPSQWTMKSFLPRRPQAKTLLSSMPNTPMSAPGTG